MSSRLSKTCARFTVIGILGAAALYPGYVKLRNFNQKVERLTGEISAIEEENRALREEIKALREDPFYVEKQAREMGLTRKGEKVFRVRFIDDEGDNHED